MPDPHRLLPAMAARKPLPWPMARVTGVLATLVVAGPVAAQFNGADGGTGAKFSLIDPAVAQQHAVRDFHAAGATRFGFRNLNAELVYNLSDAGGRTAGFSSLSSGGVTVYDQRPLFVVRTAGGAVHTTATGQAPVYPKCVVSGDCYRDYYFRPFKFGGCGDALGEVRYHAYGDRIHEVNALSCSGGDFGGIEEVYLEYPVAFASYQVYQGVPLTPTAATGIASGAVIIRRPNGSLLGFTFPPCANNGSVEFVEAGGQLLVRHRANLAAATSSIGSTRLLEWGRRVFAAPSHDAGAAAILAQMREELEPLPASAFSVTKVSGDDSFHNQQITEQVAYDRLAGVYRFRSDGLPWGDAVTNCRNKYVGGRVTITPPSDRLIYLQHESNSPDTAAVLQDANGHTLPVRLGITRSLGGDGVPDWTGQFANKDMFTSASEATRAWGRTQFPVRLRAGSSLTFNVLNVVHNWGYKQCAASGSVIAHTPLATSNRGVWSAVDLAPWEGVTGDFRGFSSTPTAWAWGIPGPGREEHFAHALEMAWPSIGVRPAQHEDAWFDCHAFSHFCHRSRHAIANGKVDMLVSFTELPETNEHRLLCEVEFMVNRDLTLGADERINVFRLLPNRLLFYNAFFRSTADDTLEREFIAVSADPGTPSADHQTRILEGAKPSFALADKRWVGDPGNADPADMSGVEGNFFVRVMSREVTASGQPANHLPLALRVGKRRPEGNAWDPWGNPVPHGYYVSYDLALEQPALALKAGDRLRFLLLIMPYGGKASDNEVTSALAAYHEYAMPELVAVHGGTPVSDANPWLPTVCTDDGRTARLTVRGGRELLTIAAEGFSSYRPPALFRIDGGQRTRIDYSVNGHDGATTYLDARNTVGFSVPVDMTVGQESTFEFVQDGAGSSGFDGGSLDGWTDLTPPNDNTGPRHWALAPPAFPGGTHNGPGAVGQHIVGGNQDSSHPTLVLRSPAFTLDGSGDLTTWLRGGTGSGSLAGTPASAMPANSTNPGFLGIALRNTASNTWVLSRSKPSPGDAWQQVTMTAAQLAALDQAATYTLDLIDAAHGGWGWVAMDGVTIPGTHGPAGCNSPPALGTIPDMDCRQDAVAGPVPFTVADAETPAPELALTATSSNNTLAPPANITFGGQGGNRTITVRPAAGRSGSTTITVRLSDGELSATASFKLTVSAPHADPLAHDFDGGDLQGWTDLTPSNNNTGPRHWAPSPPAFPDHAHGGAGAVGQHIVGGTQDSAHPTLVLRSPEFRLDGSGPLTAWLCGGPGSGTLGATVAAQSSNPGFQGIAVRDATTGRYLLHASRTDAGDDWQQVTIDDFQLAQLDPAGTCTLDLIDQGHGGWGWVAMDSVTIPGAPAPPEFAIHGGDRDVDSPTTVITGSANPAGIASPMWFEVRTGGPDGPLVDFGAFVPQAEWALTVRHLRGGTNVLDVLARSPGGIAANRRVLVSWPESANPPARPRPVPAEVWWGGLSNNRQLLDPARPWEFVKIHQDGYFLHSAGYGGLDAAAKQALAAMLRPYRTRFSVELGGATSPDPGWADGHFDGWGNHLIEQENLGLVMSDFTHDTHVELMEDFCRANPSWPPQDLVAHYTGDMSRASPSCPLASGQWRDVFLKYHAARPHAKIGVTSCPVYWSWDEFPQLAGVWNNLHYEPLRATGYHPDNTAAPPVRVNGEPVAFHFNARDIHEGFVNMSREIGRPHFELFSDVPWEFFADWGAGSPVLRAKIRACERFLQARGARHTLICNAGAAASQPGDADARDAYYKQKSLDVMFTHQLEGGRANRYLFESWYPGIPNTCTPETTEGSFANLALTAIRHLKGIRDVAGTPETLALARISHGDGTGTITLANTGSAACLPALTASHGGAASLGALYQFEGADVTAAMLGAEGFVPPRLLAAGATIAITCTATTGPDTPPDASLDVVIEAFWNPQDPTGLVRDRLAFTLTPPPPGMLAFDFDDGTLQGWTVVSSDPRQFFALTPPGAASPNLTPHGGGGFVGLHIPAFGGDPFYCQDSAHATLWLRSPPFRLNAGGDLTAWLAGGHGYGADATGKRVADVPGGSFDDPGNTIFPSFLGIALRNADTEVFVLAGRKTSPGNEWQQVTLSAAQLAALDHQATYTLDLLDARHGGWGWVNLDSVSISGEAVAPPAHPYAAWVAAMGLTGAAAGFLADPDHDAIPNGLEFVLGGQPNPALAGAASNHLLPTGRLDDANLVFAYTRTNDSACLNPVVEFTADPSGPWATAVHGANATITTTPIPGRNAAIVTVAIPANGAPALFARLKVAAP